MTANGVDVAYPQATVAWDEVRASFALIKATEAASIADAYGPANFAGARAAGIPFGSYHFAHPDEHSADAEAAWFLDHAQQGGFPWGLDVESRKVAGHDIDPLTILGVPALAAWCDRFAQLVTPALGLGQWYSYRSYAHALVPSLDHSLWTGVWLSTANGDPSGQYLGSTWPGGLTCVTEQWGATAGEPGFSGLVDHDVTTLPTAPPAPTPEPPHMTPDLAILYVDKMFAIYYPGKPIDQKGWGFWVEGLMNGSQTPGGCLRKFATDTGHAWF